MNELEMKTKIRERYKDVTDEDAEEMYQTLKENNAIPKNDKELDELFQKLDVMVETLLIDDSDEFV